MVGRNDPCICGSGKKYKKCCQAKQVVQIDQILYDECRTVIGHLIEFTIYENRDVHRTNKANKIYERARELQDEDTGIRSLLDVLLPSWAVCFEKNGQNKTRLAVFIDREETSIRRERTRRIVSSWRHGARAVAGIITHVAETSVQLKETLTGQTIQLKKDEYSFEEGQFVMAMILPFEDSYLSWAPPLPYSSEDTSTLEATVKRLFEESGEATPDAFLSEFFIETVIELLMHSLKSDWPDARHEEVFHELEHYMKKQRLDEETIDHAGMFWMAYCQRVNPRLRNPSIYAAALYYVCGTEFGIAPYRTQKELAKAFNTTATSISKRAQELSDFYYTLLGEMETMTMSKAGSVNTMLFSERALWEMTAAMGEEAFDDMEAVQHFLEERSNKSFIPQTSEQKAQAMLYDALIEDDPDSEDIAIEAMSLDPDAVDAYAILAEWAETDEKEEYLWKQALAAGERKLGKEYFLENKGHFWGLVETRPYMRAKYHYAQFLAEDERCGEAAAHLEEMIELNPTDNQGVRDPLLVLYCELEAWKKAERLLKEFEGGFIAEPYWYVLIELLQNGITAKAKRLWKKAVAELPDLTGYILDSEQIFFPPESYQPGSREEIELFFLETELLWERVDMEEFLKRV